MAHLSSDDEEFILSHPLGPSLDPLRSALRKLDAETGSASSDDTVDLSASRDAISDVLYALLGHPVAKRLRSSARRPLSVHIATLYGRLQSDTFDLSPFEPLQTAVATNASDADIWKLVLQLVDNFSRITPPPSKSILNSFQGTPWTRSSASHQGSDQTRRDLEQPLRMELAPCTFEDIPEFFEHYFENKKWCSKVSEICGKLREANNGDLLKGFPETHEEDKIWTWLDDFQATYLAESRNGYCCTTSKGQVATEAERQLDLVVQPRDVPKTERLDMGYVRVVGELTSSAKSKRWLSKFIQLATYIRDVFTRQPTRPFVHAFLLFESQMQLWVFDRSGAYSSQTFDIFEQAERFVHVIAAYTLMTEEELGCDTFIQRTGKDTTVSVKDALSGEDRAIALASSPFVVQRSIVSRATACYLSKDEKHVIKFSWRPVERKAESEYLREAEGVNGVAQLEGSRDITSIRDSRQGLTFTRKLAKKIQLKDSTQAGSAHLSFTSQSAKSLGDLSISGSKRSNTGTDEREAKRSRRSSLHTVIGADDEPKHSSRILDPPPLFRNRILTCVAITPAGRPLRHFKSITELLTGMRDAIRGHKTLYMERQILHRDVSEHNIILTDPKKHGYAGALIDLDLAVGLDDKGKNEQSGSRAMTGTLEFMALEILKGGLDSKTAGIEHTYRHDLESFFYVVISVCTKYGWQTEQSRQDSPLHTWYTGKIEDIYFAKRGAMEPGGFESVLSKFSPLFANLKTLASELRNILFSEGALETGTAEDPRPMYDATIKAYDKALQALGYISQRAETSGHDQTAPKLKRKRTSDDEGARKRENTYAPT